MKTSRSGFTLVEILVVITIIGLVAAIALPAIGQALARARNAAIKTEIDMLHLAVMNYRNEYGAFPPSGTISLDAAARHLQRLFPRITLTTATTQLNNIAYQNVGTAPAVTVTLIHPANALPLWLFGYTSDPTQPIYTGAVTTLPRAKLYDFDAARLSGTFTTYTPRMQYFTAGKPASSYIYLAAPYVTSTFTAIANNITNAYFALQVPLTTSGTVFNTAGQPFFNPDTFQILSAGRDEVWGTEDDLSNFWPGTRQDYIDSLSN